MPEWRRDPITGRWVIIATERSKRPSDFKVVRDIRREGRCPLCPGHEEDTPPEVLSFRTPGTPADRPGWWVRVVPNKFPAVLVEEVPDLRSDGLYEVMNGLGAHEVVVETTEHEQSLEVQSVKQVEEVIWAWRSRSLELRKDTRLKYIQIFKNFGQTGGASLEHAHSQIIAIPMLPAEIHNEMNIVKEYRQKTGRCIYCDILSHEIEEKQRLVVEGGHFVSFVPFAARFPFEMLILPREHQSDFAHLREEQVRDLAAVTQTSLLKLFYVLNRPPYNMVVHTAPVNIPLEEGDYHWHIEILPRLTIMAGFELGTGFYINPTPPEMAAQSLRDADLDRRQVSLSI